MRLSWRIRVSLDSRKGIGILTSLLRLWMTLPRVVRERFIFRSSLKCPPAITSPLLIFSEPARSHKFILALFKTDSRWDKIEWRNILSYLDWSVFFETRIESLHNELKNCVWSATLCIHGCGSDYPVLFTPLH